MTSVLTELGLECGVKPKLGSHIVTCHCWMGSSRVVVGTKGGRVIVVEDADIVADIFPFDADCSFALNNSAARYSHANS